MSHASYSRAQPQVNACDVGQVGGCIVLPWMLNDGILFEDDGLLLRWGTEIERLRTTGSPAINDRGSSLHLTWSERHVLGTLNVNASACQIREKPNPRAFHIYLAEFHWVCLDLIETHDDPQQAHRQLRRVHDHLSGALGPATFSYPDYSHGLPGIFWELQEMTVSAGPALGRTSLKITISHTPDGLTELEAEAARIRQREGDGARVEYVAWDPAYDA